MIFSPRLIQRYCAWPRSRHPCASVTTRLGFFSVRALCDVACACGLWAPVALWRRNLKL